MSVMKYEQRQLKIYKNELGNTNINDLDLVLENKTNNKIGTPRLGNPTLNYIDVKESFFVGKGYYIAVLSKKNPAEEIEKYGFYYGDRIRVEITEKTRTDRNGVERCYLKIISTDDIPEKMLYLTVNGDQDFKIYLNELKANTAVYYTLKKPDSYDICVEELEIGEDVFTENDEEPNYGIVISVKKDASK